MSKTEKRPLTGFAETEEAAAVTAPGGAEPVEVVTLRVTVPVPTWQRAGQLARGAARRPLEIVLAALVNDLAVAQVRSGSWEYERVTSWLGSHVWAAEPTAAAPRLRRDEVLGCAPGAYPWDGWEQFALAQGVPASLAGLGRAVIREAWQHDWDEVMCALCGWRDDGSRMLDLALRDPVLAQARWSQWLETDGGRNDPETGETL